MAERVWPPGHHHQNGWCSHVEDFAKQLALDPRKVQVRMSHPSPEVPRPNSRAVSDCDDADVGCPRTRHGVGDPGGIGLADGNALMEVDVGVRPLGFKGIEQGLVLDAHAELG